MWPGPSNLIHLETITLDKDDLAQARRYNRTLAWAPRFRLRHRFAPRLIQTLVRVSQIGGAYRMARRGCQVETWSATANGLAVPVRILRPAGPVHGLVLDIHGGGWAVGNAAMDDGLNAAMVAACQVAVISVDYRLFGRTPLRGLLDDCLAAACWLLSNGLPEYRGLPVVITGESAGAHLAAATLLQLKAWPDLLRRIRGALLYYGLYDLTGTASARQANAETLVLDGPGIMPALSSLTPGLSEAERRQPPLSPLYGDLQGLPPALMFVGELDPLYDDTTEMAKRWRMAAEVELHLLPETPHGFIRLPTRVAKRVLERSHRWLLERLENSPGL